MVSFWEHRSWLKELNFSIIHYGTDKFVLWRVFPIFHIPSSHQAYLLRGSLQLDFNLQELPVQETFFCVMSLKRNLFSRIYKYYHWSQRKQNTYLAECSMKVSKSKGQDIKVMARRHGFTEINLLLGSHVLPRSPRLLWSAVERNGNLWGGIQQVLFRYLLFRYLLGVRWTAMCWGKFFSISLKNTATSSHI